MQIGTRFSIALHILLCVVNFSGKRRVTSDFLAASAHINSASIRKIMGLLRAAGLIEVASGTGGITLTKKEKNITLKDVFLAVNPIKDGKLFTIHKNPEKKCPVGKRIVSILAPYFLQAQNAMQNNLAKTSLQDLLNKMRKG